MRSTSDTLQVVGRSRVTIGRHGSERVAKAVLVGAVPPLMLKTANNPEGLPIEAFRSDRAGVKGDRSHSTRI